MFFFRELNVGAEEQTFWFDIAPNDSCLASGILLHPQVLDDVIAVGGDVMELDEVDAFLRKLDVVPVYDCVELDKDEEGELTVGLVECESSHNNFICRGSFHFKQRHIIIILIRFIFIQF